FRNKLKRHYSEMCVLSGCKVDQVLEAAHITPYRGNRTNSVQNGLLLRADLHALWDRGLVAIDPQRYTIWFAQNVREGEYAKLAGRRLERDLVSHAQLALRKHWEWVHGEMDG